MSHKKFISQTLPAPHGTVTVTARRSMSDEEIARLRGEAPTVLHTAEVTHADIFADEDLPKHVSDAPKYNAWTCPHCGTTNSRKTTRCMAKNCPTNLPKKPISSDVTEVGLEETEEAVVEEVIKVVSSVVTAGHQDLTLEITQTLRNLFDALDRHQGTRPTSGAHRSRGFTLVDRHGEVKVVIVIPIDAHRCGTMHATYPGMHTDYSVEWSQDAELHDKLVDISTARQERERRERARDTQAEVNALLKKAHALKAR